MFYLNNIGMRQYYNFIHVTVLYNSKLITFCVVTLTILILYFDIKMNFKKYIMIDMWINKLKQL